MLTSFQVLREAEREDHPKTDADTRRALTPDEFLSTIQERVSEMLKTRDQVALLLSGPSGAGKTTITKRINELDLGAETVEVDIDRFFATLRHDRERLMRSEHDWWSTIYDYPVVEDVLRQLHALGKNSGEVALKKTYHVDHFRHDETQNIPAGKKLLVMPGHDFYQTAKKIYEPADTLRAVLMRRPQQSLEAAIVRDVHDGKASDHEALKRRVNFRSGEFRYQFPRYEEVLKEPDVIEVDNRHLETDWSLVTKEQRRQIEAALQAKQLEATAI